MQDPEPETPRRFGGIARLYGAQGLTRLRRARVCVVGLGGVGSWTAEALARSGVGQIRLVDLDHVAESNINRQIHAMDSTLGMAKIQAMDARLRDIDPTIRVELVEDFLDEQNAAECIADVDVVVDAVDHLRAKLALVLACRAANLPLIICGSVGGKKDPRRILLDDLGRTEHDALLAKLRKRLREQHGYPRRIGARFGIPAIYCAEAVSFGDPSSAAGDAPQGLSCAGYGSSVAVTASVGLAAAAWVMETITAEKMDPPTRAAI